MSIKITKMPDMKPLQTRIAMAGGNALREMLPDEIAAIKSRVQKGLDVNNSVFNAYSREYAQWRADKNYRVHPPNLTVTGRMLASIIWEVRREGWTWIGRIFFNSATQREKARANSRWRDFFGIDARRRKKFEANLTKRLMSNLK
jgi:hypothetical protein